MHIQSSVSAEVHAKLVHLCKQQNRSLRGALRELVEAAVATVELPNGNQKPVNVAPSVQVVTPQTRVPSVVPIEWSQFDPQRKFFDLLSESRMMWIPDAIAEVRQACEDFGGISWTPKLPSVSWLAKYSARAAAAGRDADADIAAGGG